MSDAFFLLLIILPSPFFMYVLDQQSAFGAFGHVGAYPLFATRLTLQFSVIFSTPPCDAKCTSDHMPSRVYSPSKSVFHPMRSAFAVPWK